MRSKFYFSSAKHIFGTNIFSMNTNKLKIIVNSSKISSSIGSAIRKINYNNLLISDQINNLGRIDLSNCLKSLNLKEEKLELLGEESLNKDLLEVIFKLI